ncbi:lysosome-associated membrane glycoprotein 3 precursor, partial [Daubentonia madagascariensis]
ILQDGSQTRAKAFPETRVFLQPTIAATARAMAKLSVLQPTKQVPHETLAARSIDGHITSQIAATVKTPTTTPVTTKNTPSTSPISHTLITTQATANNSHMAALVTEATIGTSLAPHSQPPTITPPAHTTGTSPPTVSCITGQTTQPSNQTTHPTTLSTAPHKSTTSQKPIQPSHALGTTTAAHNATQTASPASTAPGPTLAPHPSSAKTGTYQVLNGSRLCIKAEMGIELIVQDKESVFSPQRYFNIEPNATQASGNCGSRKSNLLLNFQGGFVNLTFTKDEKSYYISEVGAYLTVSNPETIYQGLKSAVVLFETVVGHSFRCVSEQSLQLSAHLQLKTTNVQLQAFDFEDDHFGNVDECSSDYTIVLPVIGAIVVGLFLVGMGVYRIRLRCQSSGYQRI